MRCLIQGRKKLASNKGPSTYRELEWGFTRTDRSRRPPANGQKPKILLQKIMHCVFTLAKKRFIDAQTFRKDLDTLHVWLIESELLSSEMPNGTKVWCCKFDHFSLNLILNGKARPKGRILHTGCKGGCKEGYTQYLVG
jgi:hypothetical protein